MSQIENETYDRQNEHLAKIKQVFEMLNRGAHNSPCAIMKNELGFSIGKRKSLISEAGNGVFVMSGMVKAFSIVALYPGESFEPRVLLLAKQG